MGGVEPSRTEKARRWGRAHSPAERSNLFALVVVGAVGRGDEPLQAAQKIFLAHAVELHVGIVVAARLFPVSSSGGWVGSRRPGSGRRAGPELPPGSEIQLERAAGRGQFIMPRRPRGDFRPSRPPARAGA